jgi:hypothetical protein
MAHFAKISEEGIVLSVIYIEDKYLLDENNQESESVGQQYLQTHNNWPANLWIKTSYNTMSNLHRTGGTPFRGNYAQIGYKWYSEYNCFLHQKQYASWVFNSEKACWISPIGNPPSLTQEQLDETIANGDPVYRYDWNETNQTWDLVRI